MLRCMCAPRLRLHLCCCGKATVASCLLPGLVWSVRHVNGAWPQPKYAISWDLIEGIVVRSCRPTHIARKASAAVGSPVFMFVLCGNLQIPNEATSFSKAVQPSVFEVFVKNSLFRFLFAVEGGLGSSEVASPKSPKGEHRSAAASAERQRDLWMSSFKEHW